MASPWPSHRELSRSLLQRLSLDSKLVAAADRCATYLRLDPTDERLQPLLLSPLERGLRHGSTARPFLTVEAVAALRILAGDVAGLSVAAPVAPLDAAASLMGVRVLVTGATGFVGATVVKQLLAAGAIVTATGRDVPKGRRLKDQGAKFIKADLADAAQVMSLCAQQQAVVHSAALCNPWPGPWVPSEAHRLANLVATQNVLQGCAAHNVSRLVHISTPSVYSSAGDVALPEWTAIEAPQFQITQYSATKLQAEMLVQEAAVAAASGGKDGFCAVMLRPRAIIGPGEQTILPRLLEVLRRRRIPQLGPHTLADLTAVETVGDAILRALISKESRVSARTFNITHGEPVRLWAIVRQVCERVQVPSPRAPLSAAPALALVRGVVEPMLAFREQCRLALGWGLSPEPRMTRYKINVLASSCVLDIGAAKHDLGMSIPQRSIQSTLNAQIKALCAQAEADAAPSEHPSSALPPQPPPGFSPDEALFHWAHVSPHRIAILYSPNDVPDPICQGTWAATHCAVLLALVLSAWWVGLVFVLVAVAVLATHIILAIPMRTDAGICAAAEFKRVDYATLNAAVEGISQTLVAEGAAGRRVFVFQEPSNRADSLALLLALERIGATLVLVDRGSMGSVRWLRAILSLDIGLVIGPPYAPLAARLLVGAMRAFGFLSTSEKMSRNMRWVDVAKFTGRVQLANGKEVTAPVAAPKRLAKSNENIVAITLTLGSAGTPNVTQITRSTLQVQGSAYREAVAACLEGCEDSGAVRQAGAWTSVHFYANCCRHDLAFGATCVLHPRLRLSPQSGEHVSAVGLHHLVNRFDVRVVSASTKVWVDLANRLPTGALRGVHAAVCGDVEMPSGQVASYVGRLLQLESTCHEAARRRFIQRIDL